jgi:hypothetical protein
MPPHLFMAMFNDLYDRLADTRCDYTLRLTKQFLQQRLWAVHHVTDWLKQHGGYCDYEVLANVEEKFE